MAAKALRCMVELEIRTVSSPGTWLARRDDLFLSVSLFGQVRHTRYAGSIFPLLFHDTLKFDKVFYTAYEPAQIADQLLDEIIRIELLQVSELFTDGKILAWYESNAKSFLFPSPYSSLTHGFNGREILLEKCLNFPGLNPKLEFSTKTIIREASVLNETLDMKRSRANTFYDDQRRPKSRSASPRRTFGRSTLSSALKSDYDDDNNANYLTQTSNSLMDRPPFVVRKIDDDLIGRKPSPLYPRLSSRSLERKKTIVGRSRSLSPLKRSRKYTMLKEDLDTYDEDNRYKTAENIDLVSTPNTALSNYTDTVSYSNRLNALRARIDRALDRNRSLDRLDKLYNYYYPWRYYYDYLDDLELDLELARRRRRRYLYF